MLHASSPSAPRMSQTAIYWFLHVKHHKGKTFLMTTNPPRKDTSCIPMLICLRKTLQMGRSASRVWLAFIVYKSPTQNTNIFNVENVSKTSES